MKIAHLPFAYYPDPAGGTEVYVRALAHEQRAAGHQPVVFAPARIESRYEVEGIPVYRFAVADDVDDIREIYVRDRSVDHEAFEAALADASPDVLHIHGYTPSITRRMLAAARARHARVIFTYHTPTATCVRGTLLRFGSDVCGGELDARTCAACVLQSHGLPRVAAQAVARSPQAFARILPPGRARSAFRIHELVTLRQREIRHFLADVDHVVAPSLWAMRLLQTLGVPSVKMTMSRQGVFGRREYHLRSRTERLKIAFLGRLHQTKGLPVLLQALARIPNANVRLNVYPTAPAQDAYARGLQQLMQHDDRVTLHDPLPQDAVIGALQEHDVLAVPSQWLETGPLVVLEAFEAGIPVIGSRLGGVAELVAHEEDGLLVEAGDTQAWANAIQSLASHPELLSRLTHNVRRPRTMADVAADMERVYRG